MTEPGSTAADLTLAVYGLHDIAYEVHDRDAANASEQVAELEGGYVWRLGPIPWMLTATAQSPDGPLTVYVPISEPPAHRGVAPAEITLWDCRRLAISGLGQMMRT